MKSQPKDTASPSSLARVLRLASITWILAAAIWPAAGQTTSFQEGVSPTGAYTHDAVMIRSNSAGTNHNGAGSIIIGLAQTGSERIRGLFEFDVSAIPSGDQIDSVTLTLTTLTSPPGINNVGTPGALTTFDVHTHAFDIDETAATWNVPGGGAPAGGTLGTLLTSASFDVEQTNQTHTFADTTAFRTAVVNALAGDGILRLIIANNDESNLGSHDFARFEDEGAGAKAPLLTVTHSGDTGAPTLQSTDPADDATEVSISSNLKATFSEPIALTGSGSLTIKHLSGSSDIAVTSGDLTIDGSNLTINPPSDFIAGDEYAVEISSDFLENLAGNDYAGIATTSTPNWSFTTDGTAPTATAMAPMGGGASPFALLSLSFDEDVQAGAGNIEIFLGNGTPVETFATTGSSVLISGSEVLVEASDFAESTSYYVNVDSGAFLDLSGNAFGGISGTTTWAFTTSSLPDGLIYYEAFTTVAATDLNGTTPTVTTLAATWTATDWQTDGTIANQGVTSDNAFLPFVPEAGKIYTLEVTFDAVASGSTSGSWSAFGFGNGFITTIDFWQSPNDASPWALYRGTETPDQIVSFSGVGVGGVNATHGTVAGPVTLSIVLDTSDTQWTAEWFEGANSLRTYTWTTTEGNPTISTVGFGRNNDSDGPMEVFSLSVEDVGGGGNNFSDWVVTFAGLGGLTGVDDDPDGDGQENGVENFFGTNPGVFTAGLVAGTASGGTTFTFTHPQGTLADDLSETYRWSVDLDNFYDDGASDGTYTVNFSPVTVGGITTVTATVSEPVTALYVGVRVTQN